MAGRWMRSWRRSATAATARSAGCSGARWGRVQGAGQALGEPAACRHAPARGCMWGHEAAQLSPAGLPPQPAWPDDCWGCWHPPPPPQALDRGAALMKADTVATGHNADDVAETVLLNILRGDVPRWVARPGGLVPPPCILRGDVPRWAPPPRRPGPAPVHLVAGLVCGVPPCCRGLGGGVLRCCWRGAWSRQQALAPGHSDAWAGRGSHVQEAHTPN